MISFRLPIRLQSVANLREHWAVRAQRTKTQRNLACIATRAFMATYEQKILQKGAEITIVRIAPRSLDSDNLASSAKGVRDGIADALQINDNDARFAWVYEQRKGKPKEYAIEIRLKSKTAEG